MAEEKKKKEQLSKEELLKRQREEQERRKQELEQAEILMNANSDKEEVFAFDDNGDLIVKREIAEITLEAIDNPQEKYELYYKVLNKMLLNNLPKGEEFKQVRDYIYEEKNTFLTRGHRIQKDGRRGADGRMSYIPDINEIINVVSSWVVRRGTLFDLYVSLRELNISKGYGT